MLKISAIVLIALGVVVVYGWGAAAVQQTIAQESQE